MNVINVLYSKNNIFEINKTTYNMRDILTGSITLFLLFFGVYQSQAQSFWTETFGAGCNSGVIADGFSSTNGIWEVTSSVANTDANVWYISSAEGGAGVGNCSEGCVSNPLLDKPTLHIGSHNTDLGAIYTSDQVTDARAESPIINCKSRCNIELSFEYFKSGSEVNENLSVWYNDSTGWVELEITPTTSLGACVSNNGLWTQRTVNLPLSADNNPKVQVGFRWENDGAGSGTKPSAATYNVQLSSSDNTAPIITCPGDQTQDVDPAECSASISDYTGLVAWSDDCTKDANDMTFEQTPSIGSVFSGSNTVTMSVKDFAGNESTCTFTLSIIDTVKPIISCPADFDVYTTSSCEYVIPDYNGEIYIKDNCDVDADLLFAQDIPMGTTLSGHGTTQTVVVSVEDLTGNTRSCSFEITLVDTIKPIMVCPPDQSVNADVNCDYTVVDYLGALTITDNCSVFSNLIIGQNITTGTIVNNGIHAIVLTAEDEAGNVKTCNFDLEVVDVTAPVITSCVPNQVEPVTVDCEATLGDYTGLISVDDACDIAADLVVTQSPAIGSVINGLTTVTLTVTDLSNNFSSCTFDVDVIDTMKPVADCSKDTSVVVNANCEYAAPDVTGLVTGTDNCSSFSNMTLSQNIASGTILTNAQAIDVTMTDESGNSVMCSVQNNIIDTIAPVLTCPNLQIVHNGINCNYQITDYTTLAAVTDNCSALTLTQYPSVGTEIGTGDHIVHLLAVDASGNSSTCSFTLSVWENESPTIICPSDIATCDPVVTYDAPIVVENCSNYTLNQDDGTGLTSGDNFPVGVTIQSYLVSDASGNTETCSFTVEVFELPDSAKIITLPESYCEQKNVVLEAESVISGTGEWKVIEGTSSVNNEFATTTGVNNLSYGNNTFVWTVSTASCGSQSDTVTIQVFENPTQAFTQDQLVLCNDTLINIAATSPSVGTGSWSEVTGNASFLDPSSADRKSVV